MSTASSKAAMTLCVTLSAAVSVAQSLGDVARQERERRSQLTQHARVLTNEDLKRERILSAPPEQEEVSAATAGSASPQAPEANTAAVGAEQCISTPVGTNVPLWRVADQPGFSLGAYARALRQERRMREAQNAGIHTPSRQAATASQHRATPAVESHDRVHETDPGPALIRVARGDSLWQLARVHLGNGRLWPRLWEANPEIRNPGRLLVGQFLRVPAGKLNFASARDGRKLAAVRREMERRAHGVPAGSLSKASTSVRISSVQDGGMPARPLIRQSRAWRRW